MSGKDKSKEASDLSHHELAIGTRYIVNLSLDPSLPWQQGSMFDRCRSYLLHWRQGLGAELDFTPENIAARRLNKQLTQLFFRRVLLSN